MTDPITFTAGSGSLEGSSGRGAGPSFGRILVGLDFSPASRHALEVARARFPGAQVRLAHVTDARATASLDLGGGLVPTAPSPGLLGTLEQADEERLRALLQAGEDAQVLVGDPVAGVLEAARAWGADLIVVGTHARGAVEYFFLGSTAEKLVARSPVPVLTVRLPGGGGR